MEKVQEIKKTADKFYRNKQYNEAIKEYTKAIEIDDLNYSLYSNRAACYIAIREFENSLSDSEKVIKIKPDFAKGYSRKAHVLVELGKKKEAIEVYKLGLEKTGGDPALAKNYKQMSLNINRGILSKEALSQALMNPQILGWYTNDQKFKKKVDSLMNRVPTQTDIKFILEDSKMMKFFHFTGKN